MPEVISESGRIPVAVAAAAGAEVAAGTPDDEPAPVAALEAAEEAAGELEAAWRAASWTWRAWWSCPA